LVWRLPDDVDSLAGPRSGVRSLPIDLSRRPATRSPRRGALQSAWNLLGTPASAGPDLAGFRGL